MRRLAWLTDLHLNFVTPGHVDRLCRAVREAGADAVLLGGDIGESHDVVEHLEGLDARLDLPIYLVLGNHGFYRGSIARVRAAVRALSARSPRLHWLPWAGIVAMASETALSTTALSPPCLSCRHRRS
jgi:predicted MPP superfamily phosphohydrolase